MLRNLCLADRSYALITEDKVQFKRVLPIINGISPGKMFPVSMNVQKKRLNFAEKSKTNIYSCTTVVKIWISFLPGLWILQVFLIVIWVWSFWSENLFYKKKISCSYDFKGSVLFERPLYGGQELSEQGDQEGRHLHGQPRDDGLQPPGWHLRHQRPSHRDHRLN